MSILRRLIRGEKIEGFNKEESNSLILIPIKHKKISSGYAVEFEVEAGDFKEKEIIKVIKDHYSKEFSAKVKNIDLDLNTNKLSFELITDRRIWDRKVLSLKYTDMSGEDIDTIMEVAKAEIKVRKTWREKKNYGFKVEAEILSENFDLNKAIDILQHYCMKIFNGRILNAEIKNGRTLIFSVVTKAINMGLEDLELDIFHEYATNVIIGYREDGTPYFASMDKTPHLLIMGMTGTGKTRLAKGILALHLKLFGNGKFDFISVKVVKQEFELFLDSLNCKATYDVDKQDELIKLEEYLRELATEMEKREEYFNNLGNENIKGYLRAYKALSETKIKPLFILIDELPAIFTRSQDKNNTNKDLYNSIFQSLTVIGRLGRSNGCYLILLTQKATTDTLPSSLKDSCVRITFVQSSLQNAQSAVGNEHAHLALSLRDREILVVLQDGGYVILKVPYVDDFTIENLLNPEHLYAKAITPVNIKSLREKYENTQMQEKLKETAICYLEKDGLIEEIKNQLKKNKKITENDIQKMLNLTKFSIEEKEELSKEISIEINTTESNRGGNNPFWFDMNE